MKTIVKQAGARKRAQVNLIQRREDAAAMRSLLNTGRLMLEQKEL